MTDRPLHILGFATATVALVLAPVAQFSDLINSQVLRAALIGIVTVLGVLFLRMVFSRDIQYAVAQVNIEMRGGRAYRLWMSPFDKTWGLFGSKMGDFPTKLLRALGCLEFVALLVLTSFSGRPHEPPPLSLLLAAAGFATSIMLGLIQLRDHYPRPR